MFCLLQIVRLGMIRAGRLSVTQLGDGNYENRQRRMSWYNNTKLVIYKDKNGKLVFLVHCFFLFTSIFLSVCLAVCLSDIIMKFPQMFCQFSLYLAIKCERKITL